MLDKRIEQQHRQLMITQEQHAQYYVVTTITMRVNRPLLIDIDVFRGWALSYKQRQLRKAQQQCVAAT
jgi:hypothetical protein